MVCENKIVYFGSQDIDLTFVLIMGKETEELIVVREDQGASVEYWNASCATYYFKNSIYRF